MAAAPVYLAARRTSSIAVATANTNTDGTGTTAIVWTAGASGSLIESVVVQGVITTAAAKTQAADLVRIFTKDGSAVIQLVKEVTIAAGSGNVSVTVPNAYVITGLNIALPSGWSLLATTNVGNAAGTATYVVTGIGGDY